MTSPPCDELASEFWWHYSDWSYLERLVFCDIFSINWQENKPWLFCKTILTCSWYCKEISSVNFCCVCFKHILLIENQYVWKWAKHKFTLNISIYELAPAGNLMHCCLALAIYAYFIKSIMMYVQLHIYRDTSQNNIFSQGEYNIAK